MADMYFYRLQKGAPKPIPVVYTGEQETLTRTDRYGPEFHGLISREHADSLVSEVGQGAYLIRESQRQQGTYTLVVMFDCKARNYKLYYDYGKHFLSDEKYYDSVNKLVADGLICLHCETQGAEQIRKMTLKRSNATRVSQSNRSQLAVSEMFLRPTSPGDAERRKTEECAAHSQVDQPFRKAHQFKVTTFYGPQWCGFCDQYIWGLVSQGIRCENCWLAIHKQCKETVMDDCQPSKKRLKLIFETDLTVLCLAYKCNVAFVIQKCVDEIERREGHEIQGIYRLSGHSHETELVKEQFETYAENARIDFNFFADIHSITNAFKLYLRKLPIPLVHFDVYDSLLDICRAGKTDGEQRIKLARKALADHNRYHQVNLSFVIKHLNKVALNHNVNSMPASNLAVIFGPTILRSVDENPRQLVEELPMHKALTTLLIEHYTLIFD